MPRYIDAEKAIEAIMDLPNCPNGYSDTYDKECIIGTLEEVPTADVVEVVRCEDCKHYGFWEREGMHLCERWSMDPYEAAEPGEDDFCSFAERREE